jgi:hypothetical protein
MNNKSPRPNWWQLYLLLPLFVVLVWIDTRLVVGETEHKVMQIGAVLLIGWLANRWISANEYKVLRHSSAARKESRVVREMHPKSYTPVVTFHDMESGNSVNSLQETGKVSQDHLPWITKN